MCVYGRRRLGKSRLLQRALQGRPAVYYVGDDRDAAVQRQALAREMGRFVPGFAGVAYPDWWEVLQRWWREAPAGVPLVIDELPALVATSREIPSLLQKLIDAPPARPRHLVLCGSSQRMMHGLALDSTSPLYGRAREILRLTPLGPHWAGRAFHLRSERAIVDRYALWGGVPRYWELALDHGTFRDGMEALILDPLGPLHEEPVRLLRDEVQDVVRPASLMALIGQGCHRVAELGARLGVPATSLSRALALLVSLGFVVRETPFAASVKDSKRSFYRIADPLVAFFNRFVEPNRSRLGAGQRRVVRREIEQAWPQFLGDRWEEMVRERVPRAPVLGTWWQPAQRWWGIGTGGVALELDGIALAVDDPDRALVVEAKLALKADRIDGELRRLLERAGRCPPLAGKRIEPVLWLLHPPSGRRRPAVVMGPAEVLSPS